MALSLYFHPFSSYSWKALIALDERKIDFIPRPLTDEKALAELRAHWPIGKFPVLVEEGSGLVLPEASLIIEYLEERHPAVRSLLPARQADRRQARLLDRVFDNYVEGPLQKIVGDRLRPADRRDAHGVEEAHALLDTCYAWLEGHLRGRIWAVSDEFTLADCAAAPALFYADWVHPIGSGCAALAAYRSRLLARPSVKRVIEEARPFRHFFPGGAPDRD